MQRLLRLAAAALLLAAVPAWAQDEPPALEVGDKAPEFTMKGSDGKDYTLGQFHGKKWVVLAWFPKAFTGG